MAVAALTTATVLVVSYLIVPVAGVQVIGAHMFPESEAWKAVPDRASLLTLNAASLEDKLESNPWVEGAVVTKNWDSGIVTVEVEERRVVLDAEVEGRHVILAADGTRLPEPGGANLERVELGEDLVGEVVEFARVLESNGVRLDSVDEAGPGGIEATVEGRRVVFSGEVGAGQARALEGIMSQYPDAPIFDLRSPQRVVVGGSSNGGADGAG
ncbi:MAG TPA: FtsQ-type POTRA domain-containing protein [Rubrobacteraceae bacterium]|nr:FtsQ-type POTRA domain-containing protein [Rubrobacteraceae bacterium]